MSVSRPRGLAMLAAVAAFLAGPAALAQDEEENLLTEEANVTVEYESDGRYFTKEDIPTFHIAEDGTVGWPTYSGFRRYHSECHVCHGPDGLGGTYAPALVESVKNMDYYEFTGVVAGGRQVEGASGNSVMPAFGLNKNVMCYLDDIYVYLKARAYGDLPRGRPAKKEPESEAIQEAEDACMGGN